jgi:hypothetical protein
VGTITFISTAGKLPITAELVGSGLAPIIVYAHNTEYSFEDVPLGDYILLLTGDDGCYNSTEVVVSDYQGEWIEFECCTHQGEWIEYECVLSDYEGEWVESECFEDTITTDNNSITTDITIYTADNSNNL